MEGSTGVADGARTGLYTVALGVLFLASILLAPIAGVIPGAATSPALVLIGMLMIHNATNIYWHQVVNPKPGARAKGRLDTSPDRMLPRAAVRQTALITAP